MKNKIINITLALILALILTYLAMAVKIEHKHYLDFRLDTFGLGQTIKEIKVEYWNISFDWTAPFNLEVNNE